MQPTQVVIWHDQKAFSSRGASMGGRCPTHGERSIGIVANTFVEDVRVSRAHFTTTIEAYVGNGEDG